MSCVKFSRGSLLGGFRGLLRPWDRSLKVDVLSSFTFQAKRNHEDAMRLAGSGLKKTKHEEASEREHRTHL